MAFNQDSEDDKKISKYNAGVAIQIRIDKLWQKAHKFALLDKYYLLDSCLDRIWLELARDLTNEEYEKKKKEYGEFSKKISKLGSINDNLKDEKGFSDITKTELNTRTEQYKILMEKQAWLTRLENQLGKGTAWDEGDEYDFD